MQASSTMASSPWPPCSHTGTLVGILKHCRTCANAMLNLMIAKVGLGLGQLTQHPNNQEPTIAIENFAKDQQLRSSSPETPCLPAEHSRLQWHSTQSPDTENTKLTSTYCKAHILSWGMQMATSIASRKELRC